MGSRRWVWEQYDSDVMADTIAGSVVMRHSFVFMAPIWYR